jgi:hypothetical protein
MTMLYNNIYFDDDFEFEDDEAALESTYRRAYRDGWLAVLEAWEGLGEGLTPARVREQLYAHWDAELYDWWQAERGERIDPPDMG